MLVHDCEQGTPEWFQARLGIPTASEFDKIITSGGQLSKQAEGYAARLLAEIITGEPAVTFEKTPWMERGTELEAEAAQYYEMLNEVKAEKVGFCTDDLRKYGCSPDRLIGSDGGLEIKCPAPATHVQYLLSGKIDMGYWQQVQGSLLVTGRSWWDWMSYNPKMPALVIRVQRDIGFLMELQKALHKFAITLNANKQILIEKGYL